MKSTFIKSYLIILILFNVLSCSSNLSSQQDTFTLISQNLNGRSASGLQFGDVSADGRYVVFSSVAPDLVLQDTNGQDDVFLRDVTTNTTVRVSLDQNGNQAGNVSSSPSISSNGRFVAFVSTANNLVSGDTNGLSDAFVKDLDTGTIVRASVDSNGLQADEATSSSIISSNGRYVAFQTPAKNLVSVSSQFQSVLVKDFQTGTVMHASSDSNGISENNQSVLQDMTDDGRFVVLFSVSTNLVPADTNGFSDVFVKDLQTSSMTRVSVDSNGNQSNAASAVASISADGRYVAFRSNATNLVANDTNNASDIFIHDLQTGLTTLASTNSSNVPGNSESDQPKINSDGRYLLFKSLASNLISSDKNGISDCFIKDLQTGQIKRISGSPTNDQCEVFGLSGDGTTAVFSTRATNVINNDTNGERDIFLKKIVF